ncbi:unnamed protein product [Sphagnum tenellum]
MSRSFELDWIQIFFVGTSLVRMYAKCGCTEDAGRVSNKMPSHDMVTWNTMILGHVKCGQGGVQPDDITFVFLLSTCSHAGLVDEGMHCYASMSQFT